METRLRALSPKVAAVLFQLPPQFHLDAERLEAFLKLLPKRHRYVFEFRHTSWYGDGKCDCDDRRFDGIAGA